MLGNEPIISHIGPRKAAWRKIPVHGIAAMIRAEAYRLGIEII
jgi:hypothetical protein